MSQKEYVVTMTITGRATCIVKAESKQDALDKANSFQFEDGTDELIEWEFDEAKSAEVNNWANDNSEGPESP